MCTCGSGTRDRQGDSDALSRVNVKRLGASAERLVSSAVDCRSVCCLPLHTHHAPKKEQRLHCRHRKLPQASRQSSKRRGRGSQRRGNAPALPLHCKTTKHALQDLNLPKSIVQRLAKGVLPPNTQIQKDALLALSKGATVFVNYLTSTYATASLEEQYPS
jgi:hypothetical protein